MQYCRLYTLNLVYDCTSNRIELFKVRFLSKGTRVPARKYMRIGDLKIIAPKAFKI